MRSAPCARHSTWSPRSASCRRAKASACRLRVGIATGMVVVGDLVGYGAAQEQAVVGETPALAARLQAEAAPNQVLISARTRLLIGGLFECADAGRLALKGFAEPIQAWRVVAESGSGDRFAARHAESLTGLVGREHRNRIAARPLGAGRERRGPGGAALRRTRHRQVAHHAGAARPHRQRAARAHAPLLLAAPHQQRAVPDRRPARVRGRVHARGLGPGEGREAGEDSRPGRGRRSGYDPDLRGPARPPARRPACVARTRRAAAEVEDVQGAAGTARKRCPAAADPDGLRGRAVDRSDDVRAARPRHRPHPDAARPADRDPPARLRSAVDGPCPRHHAVAQPPEPRPARRHGRARHRRQEAAAGSPRPDHRENRRHPALHRGTDQDGAGIGRARRGAGRLRAARAAAAAGDPGDIARLADGAPRPAEPGQGRGTDGGRDRPRVLLRAARRHCADGRGRAAESPDPAGRRQHHLRTRHAAERHLQLQARAGPGRGLRGGVAPHAPAAPCAHRRHARGKIPRHGDQPARAGRPPLHECRPRRESGRVLAEGRQAGGDALRQHRGAQPAREGPGAARRDHRLRTSSGATSSTCWWPSDRR